MRECIIRTSVLCAATLAAIIASPLEAQSTRPGVGAIPYFSPLPAGTTFRVWAPNATAVRVAGTFNSWSATANSKWRREASNVSSMSFQTASFMAGRSSFRARYGP